MEFDPERRERAVGFDWIWLPFWQSGLGDLKRFEVRLVFWVAGGRVLRSVRGSVGWSKGGEVPFPRRSTPVKTGLIGWIQLDFGFSI